MQNAQFCLVLSYVKFEIQNQVVRGTPGHPGTPRDTPGQVVPGVPGTGCPGGPRDKCPGVSRGVPETPGTNVPGTPGTSPGHLSRGAPGHPGTPRDMSPVPNIINYRNHAGADFPDASLHFDASGLGPASLDSSVSWLWTCSFSPISIGVGENRSHRKKSRLKLWPRI